MTLFEMQLPVFASLSRLSKPLTHSSLDHGTYRTKENPNTMKCTTIRVKRHNQRHDGSDHHMKREGHKQDFRNVIIDINVKS